MDDVGDDSGSDGADLLDPTLMEGADGSISGPAGVPGMASVIGAKAATLRIQTLMAMQELGIMMAVTLMVVLIFFLMIGLQVVWHSASKAYHKRFPGSGSDEEADPAALVGTFKRCKNLS